MNSAKWNEEIENVKIEQTVLTVYVDGQSFSGKVSSYQDGVLCLLSGANKILIDSAKVSVLILS